MGSALAKAARRTVVKLTPDLNSVTLPGAVSKHEKRDARANAGEEAVEDPALAQVVGVAVDETRGAKGSAATKN